MAGGDRGEELGILGRQLRAEIRAGGPITFARFMEAALYHPAHGFYARASVGERGHFVTSPHLSPAFATLLARQVRELAELLDRPEPFALVEGGAGDGTLARQMMAALPELIEGEVRYLAVERGAAGRAALAALAAEVGRRGASGGLRAPSLEVLGDAADLPPGLLGCVLANELLDNVPFHRLRRTGGGLAELLVDVDGDGFRMVEAPLSDPALADLAPQLRVGDEAAVSPASLELVGSLAGALRRGYVLLVDYGYGPGDGSGSKPAQPHAYRWHRIETDVLSDPGSRDITAGVDFEVVARHARDLGLSVWGPITQRRLLLALGFRELREATRRKQLAAFRGRRGVEALRSYSERGRADLLVASPGLGDSLALCLGVGTDRPPAPFDPRGG